MSVALDRRRGSSRVEVELPASLGVGAAEHACVISNLSLGGALLDAPVEVAMGDELRLKFILPGLDAVDVDVVTRWRSDGRVGVQFQSMRAREVWALGQFLRALERRAS